MVKNWKEIAVRPEDTIGEALKAIDAGASRLVFVTDESGVLLGTLSDGDVRRALIKGISLDKSVAAAMNRNPHTVSNTTGLEAAVAVMNQCDLLVIPVLDPERRVVGLFSYKDLERHKERENWVFLMAGGFGKRLRPYTDHCPKPMLRIGGKPLLETILEGYLAAGFHKFYISVHYMAEAIKDHFGDGKNWNATIRYIEEKHSLGTVGALGLLPTVDDRPLLMMNGDILTKVDFGNLLRFHEENSAEFTMCVRQYDLTVPYGVVETSGKYIDRIIEKPVHKFFVNAGVYVLAPDIVARVTGDEYLDMPDLVARLIEEKKDILAFPIHEYWLDIGHPDDFLRAQEEMGSRIR